MHKEFINTLKESYGFKSLGSYVIDEKSRRSTKIHLPKSYEVEGITGIYVLVMDGRVVKIGESLDLGRRLDVNFTAATRHRVIYQPTNMRVSEFLQSALSHGDEVEVLVHSIPMKTVNIFESIVQTSYHKQGEEVLIKKFNQMYRELPVLNPTLR